MTFPDAQLNYWAERFIAEGAREVMTFEEFMALSAPLRTRRLHALSLTAHELQERMERQLPDATFHGHALIDPFHHGIRKSRHAWFRNERNHI